MDHVLVSFMTILLCGVGTQWLSWRLRIPGIALFLACGFIVGPIMGWVGPGFLRNDLLYATVTTFVAIILFEGSLQLKWRELKESGTAIGHLVFMGGLVTMILGALGGLLILGIEPRLAFLFGAILIVTGPTVVLPLLRQIRPTGQLGSILKWEGIAIDPIGALIAVLVYEVILSEGPKQIFGIFTVGILKTLLLGAFIGLVAAGLLVLAFRKYLVPEHLKNLFVLTAVVAAFIAATLFENEPAGFLSVTVMGIALANQRMIPICGMIVFKENLKSLILPTLFIVLAARLPLTDLPLIDGRAFAFLLFLIFIIRPLAVFISTRSTGLSWKEKLFLSFMAPRGIVAAAVVSLFSERLLAVGVTGAAPLVIQVFFIVSTTVIFYAIAAPMLAHTLKLARPRSSGILVFGASNFAICLALTLKNEGADIVLVDRNADKVKSAAEAGLEAVNEDIFSEGIQELVEEKGLDRFLALTPNQEANSLAIEHFRHLMNPGEMYQLTPPQKSKLREGHNLVGRFLFDGKMDFYHLEEASEHRKISKIETKTEESAQDILFSSNGNGRIVFNTVDHRESSGTGKVLYGLVA